MTYTRLNRTATLSPSLFLHRSPSISRSTCIFITFHTLRELERRTKMHTHPQWTTSFTRRRAKPGVCCNTAVCIFILKQHRCHLTRTSLRYGRGDDDDDDAGRRRNIKLITYTPTFSNFLKASAHLILT
jgi:hypothetical protein